MSIWSVHLDALHQKFPGRVQPLSLSNAEIAHNNSDAATNADIVQRLKVRSEPLSMSSTGSISCWEVIVSLPKGFPEDAPLVSFAGYKPPFRWATDTLLPEAVEQAINSLSKVAGAAGPIDLNQLTNTVSQLPDCRAACNANALPALIESTPLFEKCTAELNAVWEEIEKTAESNLAMQPQIQKYQTDVGGLQHQVRAGLAGLGGRRRDVVDALPLGSNEGLLRVAKDELHELEEAAAIVCKALGSNNLQRTRSASGAMSSSATSGALAGSGNAFSLHTPFTGSVQPSELPANTNNNNNNNNNDDSDAGGSRSVSPADQQQQQPGSASSSPTAPPGTFFVPTSGAPPPISPTMQANTTAATSVFSAPLSLDGTTGSTSAASRTRAQRLLDEFYRDNQQHKDVDDDDDDEADEMERRVEVALKVCIESRKAALLLRRFTGIQQSVSGLSGGAAASGSSGGASGSTGSGLSGGSSMTKV